MGADSGALSSFLDPGSPEALRIILNPEAGGLRRRPGLVRSLEERHGRTLVTTEAPGHATELARRARSEGCRTVIAAGGDGTIHEVVNGLVDLPPGDRGAGTRTTSRDETPRLGILPFGTGNDLARALELPLDPETALRRLRDSRVRPIDLVVLENGSREYLVNFAIGGFGGDVSEHITEERRSRWGGLIYLRAALAEISELGHHRVEIRLDEEVLGPLEALAVIVGNGRYLGNGIPATPTASLDDGLLDVVIVPDRGRLRLPMIVGRVLTGRHLDHPGFLFRRSRNVAIRAEPPLPFNADGQSLGPGDMSFRVVPGALPVLVPSPAVQPSAG
jgi:diacylglycerol kinase (ATP)